MSSVIVDGLFELRQMLKLANLDEANHKLRQLIMEAEKETGALAVAADPFADNIKDWRSLFLDEEHALELLRIDKRRLDAKGFARHAVERQKLLAEGLHAGAYLAAIIRLCELLGYSSQANNLGDGVRELQHYLRHHLILDEKLRLEVSSLGQFLADSLGRLVEISSHMGDEDSELNQARSMLSQPLPEDPKTAYEQLRQVCYFLTSAEARLDSAVQTASEQMQSSIQEADHLRSRLKEAQQEARQDPLTGLANRRELDAYFRNIAEQSVSLLVIDLDYFKKINDSYGHNVGDEVLAEIGDRLAKSIREDDIVARVGGEEFVAVLKGVGDRAAGHIAEQIRLAVGACPVTTAAGELAVTASAGVATRHQGEDIESLMKRADSALYSAKHEGRNRTTQASVQI